MLGPPSLNLDEGGQKQYCLLLPSVQAMSCSFSVSLPFFLSLRLAVSAHSGDQRQKSRMLSSSSIFNLMDEKTARRNMREKKKQKKLTPIQRESLLYMPCGEGGGMVSPRLTFSSPLFSSRLCLSAFLSLSLSSSLFLSLALCLVLFALSSCFS